MTLFATSVFNHLDLSFKIWNTPNYFCSDAEEGREAEGWWDVTARVTDMWQGGTDPSLDELVTSPRSVCHRLALCRCQAWVASWHALECVCVCDVRLGWNCSRTRTHVMTLTRSHQARHRAQTESLASTTFIYSLLSPRFLRTSYPACCMLFLSSITHQLSTTTAIN